MRYRSKFDASHAPITKELRKLGWPFIDVARYPGLGCDLIVKHRDGFPILLELKNPGAPSTRELTDSEKALRALFPDFFRIAWDWPGVLAAIGLTP